MFYSRIDFGIVSDTVHGWCAHVCVCGGGGTQKKSREAPNLSFVQWPWVGVIDEKNGACALSEWYNDINKVCLCVTKKSFEELVRSKLVLADGTFCRSVC